MKTNKEEALIELARRKLTLGPIVCSYRTVFYSEKFFWLRAYFKIHCPKAIKYEDTLKELNELHDLVELASYLEKPSLVEDTGILPDMIPKLKDDKYVSMLIRKVHEDLYPEKNQQCK